jgi:hypothetical protein
MSSSSNAINKIETVTDSISSAPTLAAPTPSKLTSRLVKRDNDACIGPMGQRYELAPVQMDVMDNLFTVVQKDERRTIFKAVSECNGAAPTRSHAETPHQPGIWWTHCY